jgi:hypothetical protein
VASLSPTTGEMPDGTLYRRTLGWSLVCILPFYLRVNCYNTIGRTPRRSPLGTWACTTPVAGPHVAYQRAVLRLVRQSDPSRETVSAFSNRA